MSREEIEQVEKELDEVLEIVQRPVPVKNTGREETVSLQENLQENDIENGYFHFLRPSDGLIAAFFVPVAVLIILFAQRGIFPFGEECF